MEYKKIPERFEYTKEEYKTERKTGKNFLILGLVLMVIAVSAYVVACEVKVISPNLAVRVCYIGFLSFGLVIAIWIDKDFSTNIRLERSAEENNGKDR